MRTMGGEDEEELHGKFHKDGSGLAEKQKNFV